MSGIVELIAPAAEAGHVKLTTEVAPTLRPIAGNAERLRQVLLNLTRNAIEAMHDEGGTLTLRARAGGDAIELEVEDDGPGFSEELPIFDAFFTTKEQGTGLGLSLVHRIITDHGGSIRVQSRPGQTCFTLAIAGGDLERIGDRPERRFPSSRGRRRGHRSPSPSSSTASLATDGRADFGALS